MKDFQPGDLAYVPSDVSLIQYNDDGGVSNYFTTTEPQYVLILNSQLKKGKHVFACEVLFRGQTWSAKPIDLFTVDNQENGVKNGDYSLNRSVKEF